MSATETLRKGYELCEAARCDLPATHDMHVRRRGGQWTSGLGYCEEHGLIVTKRFAERLDAKLVPRHGSEGED